MKHLPKKLQQKIEERKATNSLRQLGVQNNLVDFSSNDYLGFSRSKDLFNKTHDFLIGHNITQNGATGSRLLSGNHALYNILETVLCDFHKSDSALIFNSGYDANVGFFSSVPQRGDIILYDEYIHASIRDGIQLSNAKAYKFKHNDLESIHEMLKRIKFDDIYIVTESVFSMDGDSPDLLSLSQICKKHKAYLIVDEAHAIGVFGNRGEGLVQELGLENSVFARIITFGKAMGCHGAAILGSDDLKQYLVNFARSFIYSTALSPHALATILSSYNELTITDSKQTLYQNIQFFKETIQKDILQNLFIESNSAIHCCIVSGNNQVKSMAQKLQKHGYDVKPILSPTVSQGQERLRFCLHSFNSNKEISEVLQLLVTFVNI